MLSPSRGQAAHSWPSIPQCSPIWIEEPYYLLLTRVIHSKPREEPQPPPEVPPAQSTNLTRRSIWANRRANRKPTRARHKKNDCGVTRKHCDEYTSSVSKLQTVARESSLNAYGTWKKGRRAPLSGARLWHVVYQYRTVTRSRQLIRRCYDRDHLLYADRNSHTDVYDTPAGASCNQKAYFESLMMLVLVCLERFQPGRKRLERRRCVG